MQRQPLDYSFEIATIRHVGDNDAACFTADAIVRDAAGNELVRLPGKRMHSYVEAAEDDAVDAARQAIRRLRKGEPPGRA
ncbi:hypothetical protein [Luteibacter aegosomatissinici]|uniref:hypothetical protein n=1 Tax=Luteibacter aegosomatissinici TaxID=2911539 RepID=UPI001FFAF0C2|nr:hypothetical protein [Luteibacter aegosomatissinici]UPG95590.1 hypothetical protein L2Y97_05625 [Luteibacter aegosomatissinici]